MESKYRVILVVVFFRQKCEEGERRGQVADSRVAFGVVVVFFYHQKCEEERGEATDSRQLGDFWSRNDV